MKKSKSLKISLTLTLLAFLILLPSTSFASASEFNELRQKWKTMLTGGVNYDINDPYIAVGIERITSEAKEYINTMETGSSRTYLWPDKQKNHSKPIDNSDDILRSYERLEKMALAYSTYGSTLYNDTSLKNQITGGLDWLYANWYNENIDEYGNSWDWDMGIAKSLTNTLILMYNDLPTSTRDNSSTALDHFCPETMGSSTGANLVWKARIMINRGLIAENSSWIITARNGLSDVLDYVTSGDGFYEDGSFVQHKYFAYTGGYGKSLLGNLVNVIQLLDGSTWDITDPDKVNVFKWIGNSFEPFMYKGGLMVTVRGRQLASETGTEHVIGHNVIEAVGILAQAPSEYQSDFKNMVKYWVETDTSRDYFEYASIPSIIRVKDILSNATSRGELVNYYQFPNMARAVQRTEDYGFAISMHSNKIRNYESINGENLKGWHTGDGMTSLYNDDLDKFSDNYFATVDYDRLPGTTVIRGEHLGHKKANNHKWVGGTEISDIYGVTGMKLNTKGSDLEAYKSWFMFDDEIVAFGSNIDTDGAQSKSVETIIENYKLNNTGNNLLVVDGVDQPTDLNWNDTMTDVDWMHMTGNVLGSDVGYYFPEGTTVEAKREARTDSWHSVNLPNSDEEYTRNYLTMWLDHGNNPADETYNYVLLPNRTSGETEDYADNPDITVVEKSGSAHAVKENTLGILAVNFWNDSTKTVDVLTSNKKASVMLKETEETVEIAVSDPTMANSGSIIVEIAKSASHVISKDSNVTVLQQSPRIRLSINVNNAKGKTFNAKLQLGEGNPTAPQVLPLTIESFSDEQTSEGNLATNAVDGDDSTRWSTDGFPSHIVTDLGDTYSISQVELIPYKQRAYQYEVLVSTDGTNFTQAYDGTSNTQGGDLITASFDAIDARYVKLNITGCHNYSGSWASINEVRVLGVSIDTEPQSLPLTIESFSDEQTSEGNLATNAVDGDDSTRWSTNGFPSHIVTDLGDTYSITEVQLTPYKQRSYQYEILVSTDSTNFTQVYDGTSNTQGGNIITASFDSIDARYVKLIIVGCHDYSGTWTSINEFKVFGN